MPELAFTGKYWRRHKTSYSRIFKSKLIIYAVFASLEQIGPHLEPVASSITFPWARTIALKYECVVIVDYLEMVDTLNRWPASPEYYTSAITINADRETTGNYEP